MSPVWPIVFAVALLAVAIIIILKWKRKTTLPVPGPMPEPETEPILRTTADNTKVTTDNTEIK